MPSKRFLDEHGSSSHSLEGSPSKLPLDDGLQPNNGFFVAIQYVEILLIFELKNGLHEIVSIFGQPQLSPDLLHYLFEFATHSVSFPDLLDEYCFLVLDIFPGQFEDELGCLSAVF